MKLLKTILSLLGFKKKQSLQEKIMTIVLILERIKKALDSDKVAAITDFIPGSWDDMIVEKLRTILTSVLLRKRIIKSNELSTVGIQTVNYLRALPKDERNKKYKEVAVNMVLLAGYVMSEQAAGTLVENEYQSLKAANGKDI